MGLLEDYNVLYDDNIRNNLFEVLIICSAVGALLNLIPFFFYDLTENKHKAYVGVLKIRAMFENHTLGALEDEELCDAMAVIVEAKEYYGKEKSIVSKDTDKAQRKATKEINLAIERAAIVMEDLNKFSTPAGRARLQQAKNDVAKGRLYLYDNIAEELRAAKRLPKSSEEEKEIRRDAIKNIRTKKEAMAIIRKHGIDNLHAPDEKIKYEIMEREATGFFDSLKNKRELNAWLKNASLYERAIKPYTNAESLIKQAESYTHYEELQERYELMLTNS